MTYRANLNFEFVEILIPGGGANTQTFFNFPDLPQIRTCPIYSMVFYPNGVINLSAITGQTAAAASLVQSAYLTLYSEDPVTGVGKNAINRIPLIEMNYIQGVATTPSVFTMPEWAGQTVVWPKSFIQFMVAPTPATQTAICFGIRYGYTNQTQQ